MNVDGIRRDLFVSHALGYRGFSTIVGLVTFLSGSISAVIVQSRSAMNYIEPPQVVHENNTYLEFSIYFNSIVLSVAVIVGVFLIRYTIGTLVQERASEFSRLTLLGAVRKQLVRLSLCDFIKPLVTGLLAGEFLIPLGIWLLNLVEEWAGLFPQGIAYRYSVLTALGTVLFVAGVVLFVHRSAVLKQAVVSFDDVTARKSIRHNKVTTIFLSVLLALAILVLSLAPAEFIDSNTAVLLVFPLIAFFIFLTGNGVSRFLVRVLGAIPAIRNTPSGTVVLGTLSSRTSNLARHTQAILIVLSLILPYSMIMATQRKDSTVVVSHSINSQTIVEFDKPMAPQSVEELCDVLITGTTGASAVQWDWIDLASPYDIDNPVVNLADKEAIAQMSAGSVGESDYQHLTGATALSTSDSYKAGDVIHLLTETGKEIEVYVIGEIKPDGDLPGDLIMDFESNRSLIDSRVEATVYSSLSRAEVFEASEQTIGGNARVFSKDDWVAQKAEKAQEDQRRGILLMFLFPAIIAVIATVVVVHAGKGEHRNFQDVLNRLGFTVAGIRKVDYLQMTVELFAVAVQLLAVMVIAYVKIRQGISPVGHDLGVTPTMDYLVAAAFTAVLVISYVTAKLLILRKND